MSRPSKILVFLQFFCILYLVFFTNLIGQGIFLVLQISGFLLSLWAVIAMRPGYFNIQPEIRSNATLVNTGPYRLIRNPMYSGLIVFFGSGALHSFELIPFLVFLILFLVFILKISLEEEFLESRFGQAYLSYKKKTYRLFPFIY